MGRCIVRRTRETFAEDIAAMRRLCAALEGDELLGGSVKLVIRDITRAVASAEKLHASFPRRKRGVKKKSAA